MENAETVITQIHSTSDLITNSSSELFVCGNDRSKKTVTEELKALLNVYNKLNRTNLNFENVFEPVKIVDSIYNLGIGEYANHHHFNHIEEYHKNRSGQFLIIKSIGDNTIPSELFDMIESVYNGYRIHLG